MTTHSNSRFPKSVTTMTVISILVAAAIGGWSNGSRADEQLDTRVRQFLDSRAGDWRDLNVPAEDGQILHDIIVEHGFTRAFEIGTSTGHSTIWIA